MSLEAGEIGSLGFRLQMAVGCECWEVNSDEKKCVYPQNLACPAFLILQGMGKTARGKGACQESLVPETQKVEGEK